MSNSNKNSNPLVWFAVILLAILLTPVAIVSYAYCSSCVYYWYMPYILASFPQLHLSSFIALNAIIGAGAVPFFIQSVADINKKVDKTVATPSSCIIEIITKILIMPWVVLLITFIMFKIITCFIQPVIA